MAHGIGLSIGATTLRAVAVGRSAVTRSAVLTRYPHRPAEVGVPSENPHLTEPGLILTDFVDRVGDPVAILAPDGSSHHAEALAAEALQSLLAAVTGGAPAAEPVGVTHPAHWSPSAVEALRRAMAAQPGFGGPPPVAPISDAVAALTALQDDPGLPTRGVVVLCDVGGSGASITLADAANGFRPIAPTVRSPDFSGDLVDQALLSRVVGDLAGSGTVDLASTSAIGNLSRLRGQCRAAKERLSTSAVTSLAVDLPGHRTEVRITRTELDDAIREPLAGFVDLVRDTLQRNGIRLVDVVALASVGGGARMPVVTTTLSEHLRMPVVTSAQAELAAAIGAGLTAARGSVPDAATALAPVAPVVPAAPQSSTFRALAWSDAEDPPEPAPAAPYEPYDPRPRMAFTEPEVDAVPAPAAVPWYRRPAGLLAVGAVVVLAAVVGAAYYALGNDGSPATTAPSTTTAAPSATDAPPSSSAAAPPGTQAPEQTGSRQPPQVVTVTQQPAPAPTTEAPPPATEAPPPSTTDAPPPTTATATPSPTTPQRLIPSLPYQTIPGLPFVPAPIQPPAP